MTNALQIGTNMFAGRAGQGQGANVSGGGAEETFAALIERFGGASGGKSAAAGAVEPGQLAGFGIATNAAATEGETELGGLLAQLLEKLAGLKEALQGDQEPDTEALDELSDLLAGLADVLNAADLPEPGSADFETLNALAARLGLTSSEDADNASGALDALAALATRIGSEIRDAAPELSAQLGDLAAVIDRHAVRIETAAAQNADMPADTRKVVLLSEVQRTPATDIEDAARAAAQTANPDADANAEPDLDDLVARFKRTLAKADAGGQTAQPEQATSRAQQAATAAAAANAAAQAISNGGQAPQDGAEGDTVIVPTGQQPAASQGAAAAARPAQAFAPQQAPVNMQYVAAEITRHVQNGINRFEIRLNPPELGRIDVRMDIDQSGNVVARLAVEKSETLDLMQRDQRALERALADAGLDSAKTELEFSLRQDGGNAEDPSEGTPWRAGGSEAADDQSATQTVSPAQTQLYRGYARADAVNLWV